MLSAVTLEQVTTEAVLHIALIEVERILNDRPLLPAYDDPKEPTVLQLNGLLLLRGNPGISHD